MCQILASPQHQIPHECGKQSFNLAFAEIACIEFALIQRK
jgi:hypothetical protein